VIISSGESRARWFITSRKGGKGKEDETETHLKPASSLESRIFISSAVFNSISQTHLLKDLRWGFWEGVVCGVDFP